MSSNNERSGKSSSKKRIDEDGNNGGCCKKFWCNRFCFIFIALLAVFVPFMFSFLFRGWVAKFDSPSYSFEDIPSMTGKFVLVTGANTGIGFVTAEQLAKKGATVIAAARSASRGQDAVSQINSKGYSGKAIFEQLDLASMKSVKEFSDSFLTKYKRLDVVVLNAGVMMTPFSLTEDGLELQIATNHFGHFLLVRLLEKLIIESKSRVVVVSSAAHEGSYPYSGGVDFSSFDNGDNYNPVFAYGQSKLANILFSNKLARRLRDYGVISNSLHPGMIKTELMRHAEAYMTDHFLLKYMKPLTKLVDVMMMDSDMGALTQLYAATSPEISDKFITGKFFDAIAKLKKPHYYAMNETLQDLLWEESEKRTRLFWESK